MLGAVHAWHDGMEVKMIGAQVEIAPGSFTVIVFGTLTSACRALAGTTPFQAYINPSALTIEIGFGHHPGRINTEQLAQKLGIPHPFTLRQPGEILLVYPPQLPKRHIVVERPLIF